MVQFEAWSVSVSSVLRATNQGHLNQTTMMKQTANLQQDKWQKSRY